MILDFEKTSSEIQQNLSTGRSTLAKVDSAVEVANLSLKLVRKILELNGKDSSALPAHTAFRTPSTDAERGLRVGNMLLQSANTSAELFRKGQNLSTTLAESSILSAASPLVVPALITNSIATLVDGYFTRKALSAGFQSVNNTLSKGFSNLNKTVSEGFSRLDATFHWGFAEMMWRYDQQSATAQEIKEILTRPLDTQAKELRARGIESYNYGWFDEALLDFLDAMQKARTDYIVAQYIGNIYLFHQRDYEKAAEYYAKAARYSEPKSPQHCVVALMHEALAHYVSGSPERPEAWERAVDRLDKALSISPHSLELRYQRAQYSALLRDTTTVISDLDHLLTAEPTYLVKIVTEPDFAACHKEIELLILTLYRKNGEGVEKSLTELQGVVEKIKAGTEITLTASVYRTEYGADANELHSFTTTINDQKISIPVDTGYGDKKLKTNCYKNGRYYVSHPYDQDREIKKFFERVTEATGLYAMGDFISLSRALDILTRLPKPRLLKGKIQFSTRGYGSSIYYGTGETKYDYWGLGGELV